MLIYIGCRYSREHFEAAVLMVKAGGKANKEGSLKDVLRMKADDPVLDELKALILQNQSKAFQGSTQ